MPHSLFNVLQEMLLRSDDHTRPTDAHPTDRFGGREFVVFHHVRSDTRTRPTQACLAVDGKSVLGGLEGCQDAVEDGDWRAGSVEVVLFVVANAGAGEIGFVVTALVEADDEINFLFCKVGDVIVGCQCAVALGGDVAAKVGAGEC